MIDDFFYWCVWVLQLIGDVTGMGYSLANIVIFVIIQPALILLFFILWRREKRKKLRRAVRYQNLFPSPQQKNNSTNHKDHIADPG